MEHYFLPTVSFIKEGRALEWRRSMGGSREHCLGRWSPAAWEHGEGRGSVASPFIDSLSQNININ